MTGHPERRLADVEAITGRPLCVNGRHYHRIRQGQSCDRPLPPPPLVHRATGAVALGAVVGLGAAFVGGWRAGEWLATEGRLHLELARARAAERWCEALG